MGGTLLTATVSAPGEGVDAWVGGTLLTATVSASGEGVDAWVGGTLLTATVSAPVSVQFLQVLECPDPILFIFYIIIFRIPCICILYVLYIVSCVHGELQTFIF